MSDIQVDRTRIHTKSFFITLNSNIRCDPEDPNLNDYCDRYRACFEEFLSHDFLREWIRFTNAYKDATYDHHVKQICNPKAVVEIGGKEGRIHMHVYICFKAWANVAASVSGTVSHYRGMLEELVMKHFGGVMNGRPHVNIRNVNDPRLTIEEYMEKNLR